MLVGKIDIAGTVSKGKGMNSKVIEMLLQRLQSDKRSDPPFLVQFLPLLAPADEILARDYVYRWPKLKKAAVQAPVIDNADGFFDQLARISGKGQRAKQQLQLTKAKKGIEHQPREDWRRASTAARPGARTAAWGDDGQDEA